MVNLMNVSDQELVLNYFNGDLESLEILIRRYLKPIYSFVCRYIGNKQDAEDVTQVVFVKVWRNLKKFDREKSFKTWIFSIAKNSCIDFLRKKKTISFSEFSARGETSPSWGEENEKGKNGLTDALTDPHPLPQELLEKADMAQMLTSVMDNLSPKYRMVLFLRYNDHFTFREIAEALNEPLHTVKSRHRRALVMLREILAKT